MTTALSLLKPIIKSTFKLPEDLRVSQWADKYRILDAMTSSEPGQWRTDRTPYLRGIMDAFNDPLVEDITIIASTQVGKTESLYNMLAYIIDQDPGPTLLVMPRIEDAKGVSANRIQPMIKLSQSLAEHLTTDDDDVTNITISLDRMILYFSGANSPAALASRPIKNLFLDETDKYPHFSGKEADPIKLAMERTRTFWDRKIVKCSTPTTKEGYIWREYEKSDRRQYFVPCPHCGAFQALLFKVGVKWPDGERDPEKIRDQKLAWYECESCKGRITDNMKHKMLLQGKWVPEGCAVNSSGEITGDIPKTSRRGFWINALYSPWLTFSDVAAEFLRSQSYPELLMNFVNSWLAELWQENRDVTRPDELKRLIAPYSAGTLPFGVKVLTAGVDVQKDHFYTIIRGWGYSQESWLIIAKRAESWGELADILFNTVYGFPVNENGTTDEPMPVRLVNVDTGYRTDEVYEFCRKWSGVARAIKGKDHIFSSPITVSTIDKYPKTGQAIPGGLKLWHLDTTYFKDKVTRLAKNSIMDPQAAKWHLYENCPEEYLKQFCAEHKILIRDKKKGRTYEEWQPISSTAQAHFLDCYSEDTEVLSNRGWIKFNEVTEQDNLATVNLKSDTIEYQKPKHVIYKKHDGPMIQIGGGRGMRINMLVTPNHRMVVKRKSSKKAVIKKAKDLKASDSVKATAIWTGSSSVTYQIPANGRYKAMTVSAMDLAAFMGWYISEGYSIKVKSKTQGNIQRRVVIYQNQGVKRGLLRNVLKSLPWKYHEHNRGFTLTNKQVYEMVCGLGKARTKRIPQWIKDSNPTVIKSFIKSAVDGDGSRQKNGEAYYTVSKKLADDMQELYLKIGANASITVRKAKNYLIRGKSGNNVVCQYHLQRKRTEWNALRNSSGEKNYKTIHYTGHVGCATVPNGTLVVRRGGKVSICGNCEVYSAAAAEMLRVQDLQPEGKKIHTQSDSKQSAQYGRGSWITGNRSNWMRR